MPLNLQRFFLPDKYLSKPAVLFAGAFPSPELFYHLNKSKTQLIVTTHESTLLDLDLVRRDEIWFVEKDEEGASSTFSLNKFKVRYDAQVKKAYLLGRYGAIPLFKEIFNSFPEQEILDDMNFNE